MTIERMLNAVAAFLTPKVQAEGGTLALSETVANTLSLLGGSAGRWRVIVQFQRDAATGPRGGRALTMLIIVQQGGQNLSINPGDAITVSRPASLSLATVDDGGPLSADSETASLNNAPLMQRCTTVCRWVRAMRFLNKDMAQDWPQMMLGNAYWLNDPAFTTRQIAHEFTVTYGQDGVTTEDVTA